MALANIEWMEKQQLVERVKNDTAPYLQKAFASLADHPLVGDLRSCGLVASLALVKQKSPLTLFDPALSIGMLCRAHCLATGVIMRAVGERMIIAPPLVITHEQIDQMIAMIRRSLDLTWEDAKRQAWVE